MPRRRFGPIHRTSRPRPTTGSCRRAKNQTNLNSVGAPPRPHAVRISTRPCPESPIDETPAAKRKSSTGTTGQSGPPTRPPTATIRTRPRPLPSACPVTRARLSPPQAPDRTVRDRIPPRRINLQQPASGRKQKEEETKKKKRQETKKRRKKNEPLVAQPPVSAQQPAFRPSCRPRPIRRPNNPANTRLQPVPSVGATNTTPIVRRRSGAKNQTLSRQSTHIPTSNVSAHLNMKVPAHRVSESIFTVECGAG